MAAGRVMAPWRQARITPDPSAVTSLGDEWVRLIEANVVPPITAALASAYETITGEPTPRGWDRSAYVTRYLAQAPNRMSNTPDQVYRQVADQIAQGLAAGEHGQQLADRVQAVFVVTGNPWWENRSATVARTESGAALNAGQLAGAAYLQDTTGRILTKVWRALDEPGRTRDAHLAADGQRQPLTVPFTVGGERLMYPGDPSGSAGNVINCRCELKFTAPRETA
jgi:uncharacterized protein with gpF-like domain